MPKSTVTVQDESFQLESWVNEDFDHDEFVLAFQIFNGNRNHQPQSMSVRISREFADDEIKDGVTTEELEKINHKMLETHIDDVLGGKASNQFTVRGWLVEAKQQLGL